MSETAPHQQETETGMVSGYRSLLSSTSLDKKPGGLATLERDYEWVKEREVCYCSDING